jgi:hypothetical protein
MALQLLLNVGELVTSLLSFQDFPSIPAHRCNGTITVLS